MAECPDSTIASTVKPPCALSECNNPSYVKGYCRRHYHKILRYGDLHAGRVTAKNERLRWIKDVALPFGGDECLTWPFAKTPRGYGAYKSGFASRFVCIEAHGAPPSPDMHAAHSCGKGRQGCVNPRHLYWATPKENAGDRDLHGTQPFGEQHHISKLSSADILAIRASHLSQTELGKRYGVHQGTISSIILRKTWQHLD